MSRREKYPERSYWWVFGDAETVRQGMELAAESERDYFATCREISAMRQKTQAFCAMLRTFAASEREKTRQVQLLTAALNNQQLQRDERSIIFRLLEQVVASPKLLDTRALMALTQS